MNKNGTGSDRIAITGIGLVTSLGLSAPSSLAAIRSGIANFSEHETVTVYGNEYGTELTGARIARLPEHAVRRHLHGADRAVALLAPTIRECTSGLPQSLLEKAMWRLDNRTAPDNRNLINLLKASVRDLPVPAIRPKDVVDSFLGRCLFFENIIQATADLRSGTAPIVIVGCVDSLCDAPLLKKLSDANRVKSGTNPEGLVAGEAAGVFLLELESQAIRRNAGILAYISAWGCGAEPHPWTGKAPSIATGLRNAFDESFSVLPGKGEEIDLVIADLNGERARAHEWAITAARIFPPDEKVRELKHPADCTGDCGAAMGAVLLATAIDIMSGALPPTNIALATSDDAGARRILCLQKANSSGIDAMVPDGYKKSPAVVPAVIEQHSDDASFLWLTRQILMKAPHITLQDLKQHDERIEANLDGLHYADEAGWEIPKKSLRHWNAGAYLRRLFWLLKAATETALPICSTLQALTFIYTRALSPPLAGCLLTSPNPT